ncbi:DEAD/DEAH box helicase family protein [Pseudidiomarina sp. 1APR75-33.1]|uniref:restriction endonuclease n=1 Tax=Pseudidiomarina terrestris TaxID=2820060 RepID=UPI002656DD57|nr:DEAD/DEAH box helicase family protein [Pseudidiomarina sp. 1APR75-33.1]MDN7127041.1 DEAD/DEAH box helicase family protein [Pseudidiomarina sp. 1APR75-33.1]
MSVLKLQFNSKLDYQKHAVKAVVDLFEEQPLAKDTFTVSVGQQIGGSQLSLDGHDFSGIAAVSNQLLLSHEKLLENLRNVQKSNNILLSNKLLSTSFELEQEDEKGTYKAKKQVPHFSIEMETGTGKTYVYLRTLFELNKTYGFTKFIIVVPSVPIREGVIKSIQIMRDHFRKIYDHVPFEYFVYDPSKLGQVRQFGSSNKIQIMVINIQAFEKEQNIINREQDKLSGNKPIDFIRAANPIVIIDEPQSVEGDTRAAQTKRSESLHNLNPLCTLRYSATHKNPYNLLYSLGPIEAYDLKLVKRIEVASMVEEQSFNNTFVALKDVDNKNGIKAKLQINVQEKTGPKKKLVSVKQGADLFTSSRERQEYQHGWIVANISCEPGIEYVEFANGQILRLGEQLGGLNGDLMRAQIYETVEQHLKKELVVKDKGIKVLSLFFIDKVSNYREYNDDGTNSLGKLGEWFEEAYNELTQKPMYRGLLSFPVADVHNGYFSQDKKGIAKDTSGRTKDDEDTYSLIMRDKERLLSLEEPLRFIFSHTALREGWDNPNVFQICTLNETKSIDRKRQEIGRGLRLPVNQHGERVHDTTVNRLTVIANESYDDFAKQLQTEYEEDYGIRFGKLDINAFANLTNLKADQPMNIGQEISEVIFSSLQQRGYLDAEGKVTDKFDPKNPHFVLDLPTEWAHMRAQVTDELNKYVFKNRIVNARDKRTLKLSKKVTLDPIFLELWKRINQRTKFRVTFDTNELITEAAKSIADMPPIHRSRITTEVYRLDTNKSGIEGEQISGGIREVSQSPELPDILAYLQNSTELTRHTLVKILNASGRLDDFLENPQVFINQVTQCIQDVLHHVTVKGIEYEKVGGSIYEMHNLEEEAERGITRYLNNLYEVQNQDKTLFDFVEYDSEVEREFAKACDNDDRIKFYCKLPASFKIDTPVGPYNPDWALVTEGEEKLYLVRETKSTRNRTELRESEQDKISCGEKHFAAIDVNYDVVTNLNEALNG